MEKIEISSRDIKRWAVNGYNMGEDYGAVKHAKRHAAAELLQMLIDEKIIKFKVCKRIDGLGRPDRYINASIIAVKRLKRY